MVLPPPSAEPDIRVLGPLEVRVGDRTVPVPSGAQRTLLALLVLARGRVVTSGRLQAGVWGEEQPQDPRASLHTAVARLRRTLGGAGGSLRTLTAGYVLDLAPGTVDADRFTRLHGQAREQLSAAQHAGDKSEHLSEAAALLRSALQLWRGPAWAEFSEGVASGEALALEESRLAATEDLADALLGCGQTGEAVSILNPLVVDHPLRDRSVGLLVDALHRYGRTAAALRVYGHYRERLADELGLDPPPALTALHQRVLRQEQPAAASAPGPRRSAPTSEAEPSVGDAPSVELLGRDEDTAAVTSLLAAEGLVTLVGPGGVGKTQLARHVAARSGRHVHWVELAPVRDRTGVVQAIRDAVGLETLPGTATQEALGEWLASSPDLVVLDNCEQVLDDVAAVLHDTGERVSKVLATSRERLGVPRERVYVVEPLGLPEPDAVDGSAPAVALFLARAREVGVELTGDDTLRRVGEVCRALDGLPLAVELGAARMGTLSLDDLADRLDRRFDLLTRGARTAPRRHQTLRSVIDWSFDLLEPEEQVVFTRLAVFPSSFDLSAAEAVVADAVPAGHVADRVAQLAGRSMVRRPSALGRGEYRLLESLRQYAASRLQPEELAAVRRRHAVWALGVAEAARDGLEGPDERHWTRRLDDVIEDLRAAWRWSVEAQEWHVSERLVAATWRWAHWRLRADVLGWGSKLLSARAHDAPLAAYVAAAGRAWLAGELDEADRVIDLAARRFPDEHLRADLLEMRGDVLLARSDVVGGLASYTRARQLHAGRGNRLSASLTMSSEVLALTYSTRPGASRSAEERLAQVLAAALLAARRTENPTAIAYAGYAEGEALAERDTPRALDALQAAVQTADEVGNRLVSGLSMTALVALRGRSAPIEPATFEMFARVIDHWSTTRSSTLLITALRNLVILLGRCHKDADAVELWSAVRTLDGEHPSYGTEAERLNATIVSARTALGASFEEAVRRGSGVNGPGEVSVLAGRICERSLREMATTSTGGGGR